VGLFFNDESDQKLQALIPELEAQGYQVVDLDVNEENPEQYILHIEKAEVHNPQSLDQRNQEFYAFATQHGIRSYEGMDVAPLEE